MNLRIERLKDEFAKNEKKILSLQTKNKAIAEKITQLENADIVGVVRESGFSIDELLELLGKDNQNANENKLEEENDEN